MRILKPMRLNMMLTLFVLGTSMTVDAQQTPLPGQAQSQDAQAAQNERQAAAKQRQDESIAYNEAWGEFIKKTYAGIAVCQKNTDMTVMTTCMQEYAAHVKEQTSKCSRERNHQRRLACLNSAKRGVNVTAMKWSGEEIFAAEDFSVVAAIEVEEPVERRPAEIKPTTVPASPTQVAQNETAVQAQRQPATRPVAEVQAAADFSSIPLRYRSYATNLSAGRHDLVHADGSAGLSYGYGVFMGAYRHCPHLKTTDIPISRIYVVVQKKFWLDVVGLDDKVINFEDAILPVLLTAQWMTFVNGGVADANAVVATLGCNQPETQQMVASAEKLTVTLLSTNVGRDGVTPYKRPPFLTGLPETTQILFDEYHFCKLRTGQTDHLGSFGPCDEALFQYKLSEARAKGMTEPTANPINYWVSSKGPVGLYAVRTYGTDVIFYEAPANFTPEIPDTESVKLPLNIKVQLNEGKRDRIWKVRLSAFGASGVYGKNYMYYQGAARDIVFKDYMDVGGDRNDVLLDCSYYGDGRTVEEVSYWYKTVPKLADPDRLRSRMTNHPMLLVMEPRGECPPVFTAETRRKRQALFDSIR